MSSRPPSKDTPDPPIPPDKGKEPPPPVREPPGQPGAPPSDPSTPPEGDPVPQEPTRLVVPGRR